MKDMRDEHVVEVTVKLKEGNGMPTLVDDAAEFESPSGDFKGDHNEMKAAAEGNSERLQASRRRRHSGRHE